MFLLRNPQILPDMAARAYELFRVQGINGLWQGFSRDFRQINKNPVSQPLLARSYHEWLADRTITNDYSSRPAQQNPPSLSIILILKDESEKLLRATLDSIRQQAYVVWEVLIVCTCAATPKLIDIIEEYQRQDARIRSGGLAGPEPEINDLLNNSLNNLAGDYFCLLESGDELSAQALKTAAAGLGQTPAAIMAYSDEDMLDERGKRNSPYFKPDWNPLLLAGQNYLGRMTFFSTSRVIKAGGFTRGLRYAYEWEMGLRLTRHAGADEIIHIPHILCHRYQPADKTDIASLQEIKQRRQEEKIMLHDHFEVRNQHGVELTPLADDGWQVRFPLPKSMPLVSIIIPTRNAHDLLKRTVESIYARTDYPNFELLIVDNQSDDKATLAYLERLSTKGKVRILAYDAPFNYSAINNFAVQEAEGGIICLLNNDVEVISTGWLTEMLRLAIQPEIGTVGALLYYPDDTIQHAGIVLGMGSNGLGGVAGHAFCGYQRDLFGQGNRLRFNQNISAVTGACLMVRRQVFDEVGGFEAEHLPVTFNDVDLCLRIQGNGYLNALASGAELYHYESLSRGRDDSDIKQIRASKEILYMRQKWGEILTSDPYFPTGELGMLAWT